MAIVDPYRGRVFKQQAGRTSFNFTSTRGISSRGSKGGVWSIPRYLSPYAVDAILPDKKKVKLIYSEQTDLAVGAGDTYNSFKINLNSLFDPNATIGLGHQPRGFDQLAALYNKYVVTSCRIEITPLNKNYTDLVPVKYTLFASTDATFNPGTPGLDGNWEEHPLRISNICQSGGHQSNTGSTVNPRIVQFIKLKDIINKNPLSDDNSEAAVTTNPVQTAMAFLVAGHGSGNAVTATFQITLTYWAQMRDFKDVAQS